MNDPWSFGAKIEKCNAAGNGIADDTQAVQQAFDSVRGKNIIILCDCERSANGLGLAGRECDCEAGTAYDTQIIKLTKEESEKLFAAILNPPEPTQEMRDAVKRYKKLFGDN